VEIIFVIPEILIRELFIQSQPLKLLQSSCKRNKMAEKETRNFALRDKDGKEIGVFTGKLPRQAALKAANRGYTDIRLRERGTKKVHVFTGSRKQVKKPKGAPAWMPDKIWKPVVKKVGVEKLENLETATSKVVVVKRRK
jgi:hypothetical protein